MSLGYIEHNGGYVQAVPHAVFKGMCDRLTEARAHIDPLDTTYASFESPAEGRATLLLIEDTTPVISEKQKRHVAPNTSLGRAAVAHITTTRVSMVEGEIVVEQREMRQNPDEVDGFRSTGSPGYEVLAGEARAKEINRIAGTIIVMT